MKQMNKLKQYYAWGAYIKFIGKQIVKRTYQGPYILIKAFQLNANYLPQGFLGSCDAGGRLAPLRRFCAYPSCALGLSLPKRGR